MADEPIRCRCDGGAYEVKEHPFLVHPDCPIHGRGEQLGPLRLTLEEAVARHGLTFWRNPNTSAWVAGRIQHISPHDASRYSHAWEPFGVGVTWVEAATQALGRPVVERDDTAELRAAVKEWAEAMQATIRFVNARNFGSDAVAAAMRLDDAERTLMRLAGMEQDS